MRQTPPCLLERSSLRLVSVGAATGAQADRPPSLAAVLRRVPCVTRSLCNHSPHCFPVSEPTHAVMAPTPLRRTIKIRKYDWCARILTFFAGIADPPAGPRAPSSPGPPHVQTNNYSLPHPLTSSQSPDTHRTTHLNSRRLQSIN